MYVSARSYLTAGIALFGASAIALTPITPSTPMPDIALPAVSSVTVDLTSTANPIALWAEVLAQAAENVAGIGQDWLSDPAPILRQIITNQIGNADTIVKAGQGVVAGLTNYFTPGNPNGFQASVEKIAGLLAAGNIAEAFSVASFDFFTNLLLFQLGLPLLTSGLADIVPNILGNLHSAVSTALSPATLFPVVGSLLNVFQGPLNALGTTGQEIVDALSAGDVLTALTAVVNIPAELTGAFLNGFTNWEGTPYVGLLFYEPSVGGYYAGLVSSVLLGLTRTIAAAITPQTSLSTTATDEVSKFSADAPTVPLDVPEALPAAPVGAGSGSPEPGDGATTAPVAEEPADEDETVTEQAPAEGSTPEGDAADPTESEPAEDEATGTDSAGASGASEDEASDSGEESSEVAAGDRPKSQTRESRSKAKDKSDNDSSKSDSSDDSADAA